MNGACSEWRMARCGAFSSELSDCVQGCSPPGGMPPDRKSIKTPQTRHEAPSATQEEQRKERCDEGVMGAIRPFWPDMAAAPVRGVHGAGRAADPPTAHMFNTRLRGMPLWRSFFSAPISTFPLVPGCRNTGRPAGARTGDP